MDFFSISALVNMATSAVVGPLVLLSNIRSRLQQLFFLFALSVAGWSIFYFFWRLSSDPSEAVYWTRLFMGAAILIPFFYFHFILHFLDRVQKYRILLWIGYLAATVFLVLNFVSESYFTDGATMKVDAIFWPNAGIFFLPFLAIWGFYAFFPVLLLFWRLRTEIAANMRQSISYILTGTLVGYLGGATNYFLWYDIPIQPWGNISASFYIITVAYAITRFRLFDMRVVAAQMITFGLWLLLFVHFLLADTTREQVLNFATLGFAMIIGVFLIRSVDKEVEQRELIEKQNEDLQRAGEEKSEFMTFASHEIRNPLTAMRGYASLIVDGTLGPVSREVKQAAQRVLITGGEAVSLIGQFLDKSKLELGELTYECKKFNINKTVQDVAQGFNISADDKGLKLSLNLFSEALIVNGDEGRIKNVLGNLIDNSIKYTKEGSVTVSSSHEGDWARIGIADTGEGISPDVIPHLFKKFSRADARKHNLAGTGIGLFLAKEFVEAHDGKIWVESKGEGKGATFFIELPLVH